MMSQTIIVTPGDRYGRLVIIKESAKTSQGRMVECVCDCGNSRVFRLASMRHGSSRSCGCLQRAAAQKVNLKHGCHKTPEYRSWLHMLDRCRNPNFKHYQYYGGRGVSVYPAWVESFESFLDYIGKRPTPKHTIDRFPNPDGNYEPGNIRWATRKEQQNNRTVTVHVTWNGETKTIPEWSAITGINRHSIRSRIVLGWPMDRVMTFPIDKKKASRHVEKLGDPSC